MRHTFRNVDFDRLARFWNGFYPERYRIDAELLRQKTVECPAFDWGASGVEVADGEILGFAILKKAATALYEGPDKDTAHLAALAYREPQFGVDLMSDVKRLLRNRGTNRLVFGADANHFFPGCPTDCPSIQGFLMVEGFEATGEVADLERDLSNYENPYPGSEGDEFRRLASHDMASLEAFLNHEFPGRWQYDTMHQVGIQGPETVFGLLRNGKVEGFALLQDSSQRQPVGGAVWRNDLGAGWGSLGPIGVSKSLRGKGSGGALLGHALADLRDRGVRQCIIDWTTLLEFYGKHGFEPTRRYRSLSLRLGD
ncbi:MAG: GNAT family N-acetyltransferase [Fimbriimonas sp.]